MGICLPMESRLGREGLKPGRQSGTGGELGEGHGAVGEQWGLGDISEASSPSHSGAGFQGEGLGG